MRGFLGRRALDTADFAFSFRYAILQAWDFLVIAALLERVTRWQVSRVMRVFPGESVAILLGQGSECQISHLSPVKIVAGLGRSHTSLPRMSELANEAV